MKLDDASAVEIHPVMSSSPDVAHRYASFDEGMAAFDRVEHLHVNTFRQLAKMFSDK